MPHRVRKTRRHAKRPRERVTPGQINRVRRYFNQANRFKEPYAAVMGEIMDELLAYRGGTGDLREEYLRTEHKLQAGFSRLRRENRVNQELIEKVMRHKGWTREWVNQHIPPDA
jgi:hypothetical protein